MSAYKRSYTSVFWLRVTICIVLMSVAILALIVTNGLLWDDCADDQPPITAASLRAGEPLEYTENPGGPCGVPIAYTITDDFNHRSVVLTYRVPK
jgi:hypothetical protein